MPVSCDAVALEHKLNYHRDAASPPAGSNRMNKYHGSLRHQHWCWYITWSTFVHDHSAAASRYLDLTHTDDRAPAISDMLTMTTR